MITIAKQKKCKRYLFKLHSERLRRSRWKLEYPLEEALNTEDIISLSDSQILRFIDELNGDTSEAREEEASYIKKEIKRLKKSDSSKKDTLIANLYKRFYNLQFVPDYMCLIIDKMSDYNRANKGFSINGIKYHRLLGTNGGIKNSTIVYVSERLYPQLYERLCCGRNLEQKFVPAKLEAYQALICSGSIPVSMPKGIIVVPDCITHFTEDIIRVDDSQSDEPIVEFLKDQEIELTESDGYGIMLPSLSYRWARELDEEEDFLSGCNLRGLPWTKGMVFTMDYLAFGESIAKNFYIKDAWGDMRDIRESELIITTSMLKLWDSYSSFEDYWSNVKKYHYQISIAKTAPARLDEYRSTNYQFLQNYHLTPEEVTELVRPTVEEIQEILGLDYRKSLLFLRGTNLTEDSYIDEEPYINALMIEPQMIHDPYIRDRIYNMIKKKIRQAKIGVLKVRGNFAIIGGDPYSLMQSIFGLPVTGLLHAGECWHKHWLDREVSEVCCFRAPMTSKYNVRKLKIVGTPDMTYWYRYINTCMLLNSWDSTKEALNGADCDGDLMFTTNNDILLKHTENLPPIYCIQRKGNKVVPTETDMIQANKGSFGDAIGPITNVITSQICLQARFPKDSEEYKVLDYRILCGQLFQQNSIDKAKGIIAKPMPKHWYDNSYNRIEETDTPEEISKKEFNQRICADKKPYFFIYNYPTLMKEYKDYIKTSDAVSRSRFNIPLEELLSSQELTEEQAEFLKFYKEFYPVNAETCVVNELCWEIEKTLADVKESKVPFDSSILKSDATYTNKDKVLIERIYDKFNKQMNRSCTTKTDAFSASYNKAFKIECAEYVSDPEKLCNILVDLGYNSKKGKSFIWEMSGDTIIKNLLSHTEGYAQIPVKDPSGDIEYCGERFTMKKV